jgi:hypothetical protein
MSTGLVVTIVVMKIDRRDRCAVLIYVFVPVNKEPDML